MSSPFLSWREGSGFAAECGLNTTTGSSNIISGNASNAADLNTIRFGVLLISRRQKENIQPMGDASNPLKQLRPVTFRYG